MKLPRLVQFLCAAGIAVAGPIYNVTDLGSLGGSAAQAFGLNSNGLVVGGASTPFGYTHAFSSSGFGMRDLTLNTAASEGTASGVNSAGQIAGTQFVNGYAFAAMWSGGSVQDILGAGSYATAINDAGQAVGMFTAADGDGHAIVAANGAVTDLGMLPGGAWTSAYAINDAGQIAGYGLTSPGVFHAFIWSAQTGYVVLGTLGGSNSYGMAINDTGQVAGSAQVASGYSHAFVETDGTLHDLGTLGGTSSNAYGIDDAGDVVGYSDVYGSSHAFLFVNGMMLDLNNLIDPSSGWVLNEAYAINAIGEIAGAGMLNGVEHAFRLDYAAGSSTSAVPVAASVPEPGTITGMALGLGVLAIFRLRLRYRLRLRRLRPDRRQGPLESSASLR